MIKDKWKSMSLITRFGLLQMGVGILWILSVLTNPRIDLIDLILALFLTFIGFAIFIATKGEKSEHVD